MPTPRYPETITLQQGEYWEMFLSLGETASDPSQDLTGSTPRAKLRKASAFNEATTVTAVLSPDPETSDPNREIKLTLTSSQTRAMSTGKHVLSVELDPPTGSEYTAVLMRADVVVHAEIA